MRWYATMTGQSNGRKPKLALRARAAYMDVRRFVSFIRIKVEAEPSDSQDGWPVLSFA